MSEGGRGGIVEGRGCWCWCCCVGVVVDVGVVVGVVAVAALKVVPAIIGFLTWTLSIPKKRDRDTRDKNMPPYRPCSTTAQQREQHH